MKLTKNLHPMLTRFVLVALTATCLLAANTRAAESNLERTRKLITVLQNGDSSFYDKARACQQLGEFGTKEAIPVLAALLSDEKLSAYARSGLENIPDPGAADALRNAAGKVKGNELAGVVNSLGVLRDVKAVGLLQKLANDSASGVSAEAMLALGRIASKEAMSILNQSLASANEAIRSHAAAGCLLAAQTLVAARNADAAASIYDSVRTANVSGLQRAAATRGAITARGKKGAPLLVEQLRSSDRIIRNAAVMAIRAIPSDQLASALNAEIEKASPEMQVQLLTALQDCSNKKSLQVVQAKAASNDTEVRKTALAVLGKIGGAAQAETLLKAVADNRSPEESTLAQNSLSRMTGRAVDEQIVKALEGARDADAKVKFIRLIERRGIKDALPAMFKQAADPEVKVSMAAFNALRVLAGKKDIPALIALTRNCRDETARDAAENAVVAVCTRTGSVDQGGQAALDELKQAKDAVAKNSWVRILASIGYAKALPLIVTASRDANETVAANAIEQLGYWPDPTPIEDLFRIVQSPANPAQGKRALASAIKLATAAADERQRPEPIILEWLTRANQAAQSVDQRRMIFSGLGRVKLIESFRLLAPYLDDKTVLEEAAAAVVQIAPSVRAADPQAVDAALQKIAATVKNASTRNLAVKASKLATK